MANIDENWISLEEAAKHLGVTNLQDRQTMEIQKV